MDYDLINSASNESASGLFAVKVYAEIVGGTMRLLIDLFGRVIYSMSPEVTCGLSAFTGIVGDGVGYVAESAFSTLLSEEAQDSLVNIYGAFKRHFPTDNQQYLFNAAAGAALWELALALRTRVFGTSEN
ncbi:MAG: hypothetical protein AB8B66_06150 [Rickettsiaceae bacterium]